MTKITVAAMVPAVIVFDSTVVAIPVPGEELLAIVTRPHPVGAFIRWTRPIAGVPAVVAVYRVLITVDPKVAGTRRGRTNGNHAWRRRRSNANANTNLSAQSKSTTNQKQSK